MKIEKLKIKNLRNISGAEIDLSPRVNIITGENGAGKTTVLEAVYLLARARSFRKGDQKSLIKVDEKRMTIFGRMEDENRGAHKIGIEREGAKLTVKLDGNSVTRLSEIARALPIKLITPQTHRILEEGPELRRRLLNWGVFHVEHYFRSIMGDFQRTLSQRNFALRNNSRDIAVWDSSFIDHAEKISRRHVAYVDAWCKELSELCREVHFLRNLDISYYKGWPNEQNLGELTKGRKQKDREQGFTMYGPQRADILFKIDGIPIKQRLSRGQQKNLIFLIMIAQAKMMVGGEGGKPVFLIDDIQSELDQKSLETVCSLLDRQENQVLVTSVTPNPLKSLPWTISPRMFHVEQGRIL